jgi:hypothetical protein
LKAGAMSRDDAFSPMMLLDGSEPCDFDDTGVEIAACILAEI